MKPINIKENSDRLNSEFIGDRIEINKTMNSIMREAKSRAKLSTCLICGKEQTSFCNSHTVPAFCLRNIAKNGKVCTSNSIVKYPFLIKAVNGVNEAGTFKLICHKCDGFIFQEYEDPSAYNKSEPSSKILAQIALKNGLKAISKRMNELKMYDILREQTLGNEKFIDGMIAIAKMDLKEYYVSINKAKSLSKKPDNDGYYLFYYKVLDYVTPIAYQGQLTLYVDFDGKVINDLYYYSPKYKTKDLHVGIFPLEHKTVIILFVDNNETRYRSFYKKFRKLTEEDKLSVINYMILLYSEDYFLTEDIKQVIESDENTAKIIGQINMLSLTQEDLGHTNTLSEIKDLYILSKHKDVINILSEKYKTNRG
ncbi:MAG: hypothetical protein K2N53_00280 [Clostridia bacterium]|nr:hypothetical protein [Clostridia bacterium]